MLILWLAIGDPHGDYDHERIEEREAVGELDVLLHGAGLVRSVIIGERGQR
jgi:hypothetical protein